MAARRDPASGRPVAPDEATFRRLATVIDPAAFEAALGRWLAGRIRRRQAARARAGRKPGKVKRRRKAQGQRSGRGGGHRPAHPQLAVHGKVVRGARTADGGAPHLSAAVTGDAVVLAQQEVGEKTNEITHFEPLLGPLPLSGWVVTADGLHTRRSHARFLRQDKQAHYVFGVLANQPNLFAALDALTWQAVPVSARTEQRDRGRHEVRTIQVIDAPDHIGDLFPHARQAFLVERQFTTKGKTSYQAVSYITSLSADQASPADLLAYVPYTLDDREPGPPGTRRHLRRRCQPGPYR